MEESAERVEAPKAEIDDSKIEVAKVKGNMLDPASPYLSGELPSGHIDENGVLHTSFVVCEMGGEEEDLIGARGPVIPRLNKIISNCLVSLGTITNKGEIAAAVSRLPASDRMMLLIALRRISLGDYLDVKNVECPNRDCKKKDNYSINLSALEAKRMANPTTRRFTTKLSTGKIVKWHVLGANDEEWLARRRNKFKDKDNDEQDTISLGMLGRIDAIDDEALDRENNYLRAIDRVKHGMRMRERQEIRREFDNNEGKIDTEVEFECKKCGHSWKADLNVTQTSFFFPSEA